MNADEIAIRLIEPGDSIEELTALLHRAYADHAAAGRVFYATYQTPQQTRERISGGECWIALRDGTIVGTVTIKAPYRKKPDYPAPDNVGVFTMLAVLPALRGTGLGNRLLALAEKRIAEKGLPHAVFDTSSLATELIAWYERRGYEKIGTYKWDVTNYESVVMAKTLR